MSGLYNNLFRVDSEYRKLLCIIKINEDEIPRFRDCYYLKRSAEDGGDCIVIHTRTGGGNRDDYEDENEGLTRSKYYQKDEDDDFDCTYADFYYSIPDEYVVDLKEIYSDIDTITPAEKWQILFNEMDEMKDD